MSLIEDFFRTKAADDRCFLQTVFVFPSQIPADLWMAQLLRLNICPTIPQESFISWDTFKETAIKNRLTGSRPVSSVVRKMYAQAVAHQNAMSQTNGSRPLFESLIPQEFAEQSTIFAEWLAGLLPQLGIWMRYRGKNNASLHDTTEDRDMEILYLHYRDFLEKHNLFEPSWELPPLQDTGKKYYLMFPYTIDDFAEYEYLVRNSPSLEIAEFTVVPTPDLHMYEDIRQEVSDITARIRQLSLDDHVPLCDIAISVPDIDNIAPYLLRELALYDIPYRYRSGTALGTAPGGKMFLLINDCVTSHFSFESVKALLLNRQIPWKNRTAGQQIIERGIESHCVASWKENGAYVDIWEKTLKAAAINPNDTDILRWFTSLRRVLESLVSAKSFSDIRRRYFEFKETYLDVLLFTNEDDLIISRCIEELSLLIDTEKVFSDIVPMQPYAFFVNHLQNKKYVTRTDDNGVSIFPYKVAAGIPATYHFVLDVSQEQTTVTYGALQFLRTDQRKALGIPGDTDVSASFFSAYSAGCGKNLYMTCSKRSITGYRTPHGHFAAQTLPCAYIPSPDAISREYSFFYQEDGTQNNTAPQQPPTMCASRKNAFLLWKERQSGSRQNIEEMPLTDYPAEFAPYYSDSRIIDNGDVKISSTQMNKFFTCPLQWYYGTLLNLKEFALDSGLIDEKNIGSIIHRALERLFARIKKESPGGCFNSGLLIAYKSWVPDCVQYAFNTQKDFTGPMAQPLLEPLTDKVESVLNAVLDNELQFDGMHITALEQKLQIRENGILFNGIIDRIGTAANGEFVIFDYKTGVPPTASDSVTDKNGVLHDYQIAMYVYLAEKSSASPIQNTTVENAAFYKTDDNPKIVTVIKGEITQTKKNSKAVTRSGFDATYKTLLSDAEKMKTAILQRDFTIKNNVPDYKDCSACSFKMVCRQLYVVK